MAAAQCVKARLTGRKVRYPLHPRLDRPCSLRRNGYSGGGYQPQINARNVDGQRFESNELSLAFHE